MAIAIGGWLITTIAGAQALSDIAAVSQLSTEQNSIFITTPGKEGLFIYTPDSTAKADNVRIVRTSNNRTYIRHIDGPINAGWWMDTHAADNSKALDAVLDFAPKGAEIVIPNGVYKFAQPVVLPINKRLSIKSLGTLSFPNSDGLIVRGTHKLELNVIEGKRWAAKPVYRNYAHAGLTLEDATESNIQVHRVSGFANGIRLTGSGRQSNGKWYGSQYNRVTFDTLHQNRVGILLTTGKVSDTPGLDDGKEGWVNENTITGGRITGEVGLASIRGKGQTDPFNNNKFYNLGFEQLTTSIDMQFAAFNMFMAPRFEQKFPARFSERSRGNVFVVSLMFRDTIAATAGSETILLGNILTPTGSLSAIGEASDFETKTLRPILKNVPSR
jgi:hypothetical protein